MTNKLDSIFQQKQREVAILKKLLLAKPEHPIAKLLAHPIRVHSKHAFRSALTQPKLAVIAEIKRKSPSKGVLAAIPNPVQLAIDYVQGGANAISVLTDEVFFAGQLTDLTQIASSVSVPVLRKDFIIDEVQIAEAVVAGAQAILCIIALVGNKAKSLLRYAEKLGIDVLVEVHDSAELEIALHAGARIIGVNNRNLTNFHVDTEQALRLVDAIPVGIVKVAESGIIDPRTAITYSRAGFDAVLIGAALVQHPQPGVFIQACQS